jgi:hypothetical protein
VTTICLRISAFLCLCLVCASLSFAADKKQLSDALAAVDANLKTAAGKQYDEKIGQEFSPKYLPSLKQCKQSSPPTNSDPLDMLVKLDAAGKVQEVLVYPDNPFNNCARTALQSGQFSAPPRGDYWINIHLQPKR